MIDISKTIQSKSDQLNADDLMGVSRTIKITKVNIVAGDQPVSLNYEGDEGKPYKPCKSMRRVLVGVWGADGNRYVGQSMTLYRDPKVTFGGQEVGGIRISHMSGMEKPITLSLTASKMSKRPFTVQPLEQATTTEQAKPEMTDEEREIKSLATGIIKAMKEVSDVDELEALFYIDRADDLIKAQNASEDTYKFLLKKYDERKQELICA